MKSNLMDQSLREARTKSIFLLDFTNGALKLQNIGKNKSVCCLLFSFFSSSFLTFPFFLSSFLLLFYFWMVGNLWGVTTLGIPHSACLSILNHQIGSTDAENMRNRLQRIVCFREDCASCSNVALGCLVVCIMNAWRRAQRVTRKVYFITVFMLYYIIVCIS